MGSTFRNTVICRHLFNRIYITCRNHLFEVFYMDTSNYEKGNEKFMRKKYLCLMAALVAAYLITGCGLAERLSQLKQSFLLETQDDTWEEIPEEEPVENPEEETTPDGERRPPELLENILSQIENANQESGEMANPPVESEEAELTGNETEAAEEENETEEDDFSDIDLNSYVYSSNREEFPSDIAFANFRSLSGGEINGTMFYRSASPVCNVYNRAPYSDAFAEEVGISCVLNLSDSVEEVQQCMQESGFVSPYYTALFGAGKVVNFNMDSRYYSNKFAFALADGLRKMLAMEEGPVLIHCIEGKDRTGFVCMLFEGLAGATYQEIIDDYMTTYYNYYPGVLESDQRLYQCIKQTYIDEMIRYISGSGKDADLTQLDMHQWCRQYLYNAGLTEEELDKLEERLKLKSA